MAKAERIRKVREHFVGEELTALALMLQHWALPSVVKKRRVNWDKKLLLFRKGVYAGLKRGGRETVPKELVADEFEAVLTAIEVIKGQRRRRVDKLVSHEIGLESGTRFVVRRAPPIPPTRDDGSAIAWKWSREAEVLAAEVTALRLGMEKDKIAGVRARLKYKPDEFRKRGSEAQRILASCYFDLCSAGVSVPPIHRLRILDALYLSRYHVLSLVYLIQIAATGRERRSFLGALDLKSIHDLCLAVTPSATEVQEGPFLSGCLEKG